MMPKTIVGVLVKYHPCSALARGSVCPFFKTGSRRCSKPLDQCDMPEYDKWLRSVLSGQIRYFHSTRYIYIFRISGVPLLIYHSLKRKIIGEAAINKMTKENNIYYYWFDNFIPYANHVDPSNIETDRSLQRLTSKGVWNFRYLTEETLNEIRLHAGLSPKVKNELDRKLKEVKTAIKELPIPRGRYEQATRFGQHILIEAGLKYNINKTIIERAQQIFLEAKKKRLLRGRSTKNVAFASLFIAYRAMGISDTVKEFSEKYGLHPRKISVIYRDILNHLRLTIPILGAKDYVLKYSQHLPVSKETVKSALSFVDFLKKSIHGKNPRVIAATSLYTACKVRKEALTQKQIAKAFGISTQSIRKYSKILENPENKTCYRVLSSERFSFKKRPELRKNNTN